MFLHHNQARNTQGRSKPGDFQAMGIEFLKRSKPESEKAEDDAKVRAIVETTLTDIAARGDVAVRELSKRYDNYQPQRFRLTKSEIEAAMNKVSMRDLEDIN